MMNDLMSLLSEPLVAITVGARDFGAALEEQGAQVAYVTWSPPAGGDQELIDLLDQLLQPEPTSWTGWRWRSA